MSIDAEKASDPMNRCFTSMCVKWAGALVLPLVLIFPASVHAQTRDPLLNVAVRQAAGIPTFGDMAKGVIDDYGSLISEQARFSARIESARQEYWDAVQSDDDSEQERLAFAKMLLAKDYHYLVAIYVPEGIHSREYNPADTITALAGQIDGGIHPMAQRAFGEWAEAVRTELGAKPGRMINPLAMSGLPRALDATTEHYLEYIWQRDLLEFKRAGVTPPGMTASEWDVYTLFTSLFFLDTVRSVETLSRHEKYGLLAGPNKHAYGRIDPMRISHHELAEARRVFGDERVNGTLAKFSSLPRQESPFFLKTPLSCPPGLGDWSDVFVLDAYYHHLLGDDTNDPKLWFIADACTAEVDPNAGVLADIFRAVDGGSPSDGPMLAAVKKWNELVQIHGDERMAEIVEQVRAAPARVTRSPGPRYRLEAEDFESMGTWPGPGHTVLSKAVELIANGRTYDAYLADREQDRQNDIARFRNLAPADIDARVSLARKLVKRDGIRITAFEGSQQELDWLIEIAKGDPIAVAANDATATPNTRSSSRRRAVRNSRNISGNTRADGKVEPRQSSIARASTLMGELTAQGIVSGGAEAAVKWFERGYALTDTSAASHLSLMLLMGKGVDEQDPRRDPANTFELAQASAEQDFYVGHFVLAIHYEKGIGTDANEEKAREHFQRAARFGHPIAQRWCKARDIDYRF